VPTPDGLLSAFRREMLVLLADLGIRFRATFGLVAIGLFSSAYEYSPAAQQQKYSV
jgi:hypothetical protein